MPACKDTPGDHETSLSREALQGLCRKHRLLSLYLFGSRADDGLERLAGAAVAGGGSDLDVGVVFQQPSSDRWDLSTLQIDLEDLFEPLRVDLVPLQKLDPIFQFRAISGHRLIETDSTRNSYFELGVMRQASELLPVQRRMEREIFGVSTT